MAGCKTRQMANKTRLSPADPPPGKKLIRYQKSATNCNHQPGVSVIISPKLHAEHAGEGIVLQLGHHKRSLLMQAIVS